MNNMISQYEIPAYLEDALPEMKEILVRKGVCYNIFDPYNSLECLADFTIKNAREHNIRLLKRCFKTTENLYNKSSEAIQKAIDNIFTLSFSTIFNSCHSSFERIQIQLVMPTHIYSIYIDKVIKSKLK